MAKRIAGTAERPKCIHCRKIYGERRTETISERKPLRESFEPYRGNLHVIREKIDSWGSDEHRMQRVVWDGESFYKPYNPFCTLRCALDFARKTAKRLGYY